MDHDFMLAEFIGRLKRNSPALIVLVLCAMMTLAQWRRHPRAAFRAALAFAWFLGTDLLALAWYTSGIFFVLAEIPHVKEVEAFGETTLSCLEALGYVFVLLALNAARTPYRPPEYYDLGDDDERPRDSQEGTFTPEAARRPDEKPKE
jgi:hypothetical protein